MRRAAAFTPRGHRGTPQPRLRLEIGAPPGRRTEQRMRLVRWIVPRTLSFAAVAALLALGSGCDAPDEPDDPAPNENPAAPEGPTKSGSQALLGQDGNLTVN